MKYKVLWYAKQDELKIWADSNDIQEVDIKTVFLLGEHIVRDIFVIPPPEVNWKLKKINECIYGEHIVRDIFVIPPPAVNWKLKKLNECIYGLSILTQDLYQKLIQYYRCMMKMAICKGLFSSMLMIFSLQEVRIFTSQLQRI